MSENKLTLANRTIVGKKLAALRDQDIIPSVVYGGQSDPVLTQSVYNETEKVVRSAGYHSPVDLDIAGKKQMAIIKHVDLNPRNRKIVNIEFQAVSADEIVEATTPIVIINFEGSEASKLHLDLLQVMEEIEVKAKPSDLPKEVAVDASKLASTEDKLTVADLILPEGVTLADKELSPSQAVASVYDAAAAAAAQEEKDKSAETVDAADVPADNGAKPEADSDSASEE